MVTNEASAKGSSGYARTENRFQLRRVDCPSGQGEQYSASKFKLVRNSGGQAPSPIPRVGGRPGLAQHHSGGPARPTRQAAAPSLLRPPLQQPQPTGTKPQLRQKLHAGARQLQSSGTRLLQPQQQPSPPAVSRQQQPMLQAASRPLPQEQMQAASRQPQPQPLPPAVGRPKPPARRPAPSSSTIKVLDKARSQQQRILVYSKSKSGKSLQRTGVRAVAAKQAMTWRNPATAATPNHAAVAAAAAGQARSAKPPIAASTAPAAGALTGSMAQQAALKRPLLLRGRSSPAPAAAAAARKKAGKWNKYVRPAAQPSPARRPGAQQLGAKWNKYVRVGARVSPVRPAAARRVQPAAGPSPAAAASAGAPARKPGGSSKAQRLLRLGSSMYKVRPAPSVWSLVAEVCGGPGRKRRYIPVVILTCQHAGPWFAFFFPCHWHCRYRKFGTGEGGCGCAMQVDWSSAFPGIGRLAA